MPVTFGRRRAVAALLHCVFALQAVVGNAAAGELAGSGAAEDGTLSLTSEEYDADGDVVTTERVTFDDRWYPAGPMMGA